MSEYPYTPYFPHGMGKNEEARYLVERDENGRWIKSATVRVHGKIVVFKPEGGVKHVSAS